MFALVLAALLTIGVIRYNRERGPDLGRRIAVSPSTLVMSEHLIAFPSPLNVVVAKGPIRDVHVLDPSPSRREWSGSFEGRTVTLDSDVIAHRTVAAAKRYLAIQRTDTAGARMTILPPPGQVAILAELSKAGFHVSSLADLRHSRRKYPDAIPILLRWLMESLDAKTKGEIVRALSVPWARPTATQPLIQEFRQVDDEVDPTGMGLRWTIGNALEVVFDDSEYDHLAALATDSRYGPARQMVVLGFGKSKRPEAATLLSSLLDDPQVDGHAIKALGKLKTSAAREAIERKLVDRRAWVRAAARSALKQLDD